MLACEGPSPFGVNTGGHNRPVSVTSDTRKGGGRGNKPVKRAIVCSRSALPPRQAGCMCRKLVVRGIERDSTIEYQQPLVARWNNQHAVMHDAPRRVARQFELVDQIRVFLVSAMSAMVTKPNCRSTVYSRLPAMVGLPRCRRRSPILVQRHITQFAAFAAVKQQVPASRDRHRLAGVGNQAVARTDSPGKVITSVARPAVGLQVVPMQA